MDGISLLSPLLGVVAQPACKRAFSNRDAGIVKEAQQGRLADVGAVAKRERKGIPLLVGNIGPLTFGQDDNQMLLVDANGLTELPRAPKIVLARQLVGEIARRLQP